MRPKSYSPSWPAATLYLWYHWRAWMDWLEVFIEPPLNRVKSPSSHQVLAVSGVTVRRAPTFSL